MHVQPVTLRGAAVTLEPLEAGHAAELEPIALDEELWRWTVSNVATRAQLDAYIADALHLQAVGSALPFLIRDNASGRAAGSTRYGNIDRAHRRVEIGWTWLGRAFQRTALNTEAKLLLLTHAFERLGCIRVEFKTDVLNTRSRAALLRIGAIEEGVLRRHMVTDSGRLRDTVYFSILDEEWPRVKAQLSERLRASRHAEAAP